jgi:colanic acid biosynthesis glycosyl transferase WcaI
MLDTLKSKGVSEDRIRSLPNWADINMFDDVTPEEVSLLRSRLKIPPGTKVALYSGNMGRKQGLEVLAQVAASFPVHESVAAEVCFVFCGNGVGRAELEAACSGLGNVRFSDLLPSAEFPVLLQLADIHLLPQVAQASDLVMPSKLTAILASGRPVVASAVPGSELARVASMAGIVVDPQDSGAMVAAVMRLVTGDALRIQLGDAGRQFALAHLGRDHILMQFEGDLLRLREASTD